MARKPVGPGPAIRAARLKRGLTLREVGRAIDYSPGNISKMERGVFIGSRRIRERLSKFFGEDLTFEKCPLCGHRAHP